MLNGKIKSFEGRRFARSLKKTETPAIVTVPVNKEINKKQWDGRDFLDENNCRIAITDVGFRPLCDYVIPDIARMIVYYTIERDVLKEIIKKEG